MKYWDLIRVGKTPTHSSSIMSKQSVDVFANLENDDDNCGLPSQSSVSDTSTSNFYDEPGTITINVPDDPSMVFDGDSILTVSSTTGEVLKATTLLSTNSTIVDIDANVISKTGDIQPVSPLVSRYGDNNVIEKIVDLDANSNIVDENKDVSKLEAVDPSTISLDDNTEESQNLKDVRACIEEDKKKDNSAPPAIANSNLNTDEVRNVQMMFIDFQKKYFEDSPVCKTIDPQFFFNLPKEVYNFAMEMKAKEYPPIFNPLFIFFGFNLRDVDSYPVFIKNVLMNVSDEDWDALDKYCDDYFDCEEEETVDLEEGESEVPLDD